MEFCIYKWMLNGKYTDVPVLNRWASCMVVAVQSKHLLKQLSSSFEIHAMENYLRGLLSELETDMFKKSSKAAGRKISSSPLSIHDMVLAGPSISLLYYS